MAISNKIALKQESDGTALDKVGTPELSRPLMQSQSQLDTLKVERVTILPANGAGTVTYPTGGFPLADDGGSEITPDGDTDKILYKFSHWLADQLQRRPDDDLKIVSVALEGHTRGNAELVSILWDSKKDKVRLISLVDGIELAKGNVIIDEDGANQLDLRIVIL